MPRHKRVVVPHGPAFVPCGQCSDGWVSRLRWTPGGWPVIYDVTRCACWREHQRRLTSIMAGEFDARMAQVGSE